MDRLTRDDGTTDSRPVEILLMLAGVACAVLAVVAKFRADNAQDEETKYMIFGMVVCIVSSIAGSLNLVLARVLGSTLKLNEFDTIVYTAIPAAGMVLIPMSLPHTVQWDGGTEMTDWEVLADVSRDNPSAIFLAGLSGVFALVLNLAKYSVVQNLSATHLAFAGNFNKALTIMLAMLLGFEPAPGDFWGVLMLLACVGNISAFTCYNVAKSWHIAEATNAVLSDEKQRLNSSDSTVDFSDCGLLERSSSSNDDET